MYNIAQLCNRIELQALTETPDGQGGFTSSWTVVQSHWAKIKTVSAKERVYNQKLEDNYTHEIVIRNTQDYVFPTAKHRILFGTRIFQIHTVEIVDELDFWIVIMAEEGVAS